MLIIREVCGGPSDSTVSRPPTHSDLPGVLLLSDFPGVMEKTRMQALWTVAYSVAFLSPRAWTVDKTDGSDTGRHRPNERTRQIGNNNNNYNKRNKYRVTMRQSYRSGQMNNYLKPYGGVGPRNGVRKI